jgi:hypothetical protein
MDHHAARASSSYGSFPAKSASDTQHSTSSGAMMRGTGVAEPLPPSSPSLLPLPQPLEGRPPALVMTTLTISFRSLAAPGPVRSGADRDASSRSSVPPSHTTL